VTCDEIRGLLSPYTDAELDLVRELEIEQHLRACPRCTAAIEQARSLSNRLRDPALYHKAPANLHERIRVSLGQTEAARSRPASLLWGWFGVFAASAALVAVTFWSVLPSRSAPSQEELLARQVVAAHVRSLMLPSHTLDVKSEDTHTVKPWFLGKVDVVPEVKDLSAQGFPLTGGRLEYLDDRPAAALVYGRAKHVINVFVWKATGQDRPPEFLQRQGYNLIRWTQNERMFWVISDLNQKELREFRDLLAGIAEPGP
jgi:anti-sigma factor RsiW